MMLALLKIARSKASLTHFDNYVDLAGYAACAAEIASEAAKIDYSLTNKVGFDQMAKIFNEES